MEFLDTILRNITWPLTTFIVGITSLIVSIIVFREQLARLIPNLPKPLAQFLSRISIFKVSMVGITFQVEFGQRVKKAKARAKGIEETVAASRTMPAPSFPRQPGNQTARDIVLAAWGALQQIVYDACTASKIPLTPATRFPEAVRRLMQARAIDADLAYLLDVLYELGQALADNPGLRPQEDDARGYKELADLVADWMMISILSPGEGVEEPKPRRMTVVGGHFSHPRPGYPAAVLVGISGPVQGQRYPIDREQYRIGRHAGNNLCIAQDDYVSGNHACIRYEKGSLLLFDQGSQNGTFLNDREVARTPVMVQSGDRIRIGESVLQVAELST